MNDKIALLIEQLASKLGTTAEHLWGVLIKQAPISGTINCILIAVMIAITLAGFRYLLNATKENAFGDGIVVAWLFWGLLFAMTVCVAVTELDIQIAGVVNPEYWAIKQLIK